MHHSPSLAVRAAVVTLLMALAIACSGQSATPDLSTDDAVRTAYKKATGEALHEDDCIGRTGVKDVVVIGSFAHDRGCEVESAFVAGKLLDAKKLRSEGLSLVGWKTTAAADQPALALQWAEKVLFHWGGSVVSETNKAFSFEDPPAFAAPTAKVEVDEVVAAFWVEDPPGMIDEDRFSFIQLRIAATGAVRQGPPVGFAVDGSRVR